MNIRVALGAPISEVFALIVRQSAVPLGIGIVAGCAGALVMGTVVANLLVEVQSNSPAVLGSAAALVALAGLVAASIAARNGLRIDPVAALRED